MGLVGALVISLFAVSAAARNEAFSPRKFTNCIRLTDGLYSGTASAYSMLYSSDADPKIVFAVVVTSNGHAPDRVGSIFAAHRAAWVDRFGVTTIRGIGPLVARSDKTATVDAKAALAKHVRSAERHCTVVAQH